MNDRRDFLKLGTLGASGAFLAPSLVRALASEDIPPGSPLDEKTLRFWTEEVRNPQSEQNLLGIKKPKPNVSSNDRSAEFVRVSEDGQLQTLEQIDKSRLLPAGDVAVQVTVHGFRPSHEDTDHFEKVKGGSLRIDFQQAKSIHPMIDNLAWTVVGALFPDRAGKLPALSELKFDPGTSWGNSKNILLPGGAGSWTLNFFLQHEESFLCKLSKFVVGEAARFAPTIGLPGIAQTALKSFDSMYGYIQAQAHTEWILKSSDLRVYATQEAAGSVDIGTSLPLITGDYLVIPRCKLTDLASTDWSSLRLRRGWMVPHDTKPEFIFEAARSAVPDLTYMSFNVSVKKV